MAATRGVKKEELNFIFKSLAERGKDGEIYSACCDFFRSQPSSTELKQLNEAVDDQVIFRPYGSEAENLKYYESHDCRDIDIMIFPYSDNLMIDEERLEYSPENPLYCTEESEKAIIPCYGRLSWNTQSMSPLHP